MKKKKQNKIEREFFPTKLNNQTKRHKRDALGTLHFSSVFLLFFFYCCHFCYLVLDFGFMRTRRWRISFKCVCSYTHQPVLNRPNRKEDSICMQCVILCCAVLLFLLFVCVRVSWNMKHVRTRSMLHVIDVFYVNLLKKAIYCIDDVPCSMFHTIFKFIKKRTANEFCFWFFFVSLGITSSLCGPNTCASDRAPRTTPWIFFSVSDLFMCDRQQKKEKKERIDKNELTESALIRCNKEWKTKTKTKIRKTDELNWSVEQWKGYIAAKRKWTTNK